MTSIEFFINNCLNQSVKKVTQNINLSEKDIEANKNLETDKIKTTNVNILLNRVRLDRQRTLKKRIGFTVILSSIVISLAVYFII